LRRCEHPTDAAFAGSYSSLSPEWLPALSRDLTVTDLVNISVVSCGLSSAGAVYCWNGGNGYLGNGTFDTAMVPTDVSGGRTYKDIAAGSESVSALTTDGKPYCWRNNTYGQLGNGNKDSSLSPTLVDTTLTFTSLAMG
jgi:alpha-tubulin suppressor-like RCC1 family protein